MAIKGDVRNEHEKVWKCIGGHCSKGVDFRIDLLEFEQSQLIAKHVCNPNLFLVNSYRCKSLPNVKSNLRHLLVIT